MWITLEQSWVGLLSEMEGMASPIYKINLEKSKFGTNLEAGPITIYIYIYIYFSFFK